MAATFVLPPRYKPITGTLVRGGYGAVQAVEDLYLGRKVLFKEMFDPANNAQLLTEIQALSKARSRHVVELYDVLRDRDGQVAGIVMEYLTGRDFSGFSSEARTDCTGFLKLVYQLASALTDLHSAGVIHRDIKLDNFKESASRLLKLFDFGISVVGPTYRTKENRGTLIYAAPELFIPGAIITREMDMYALGICAWMLFSKTLPQELKDVPPQNKGLAPSIDTASPNELPAEIVHAINNCLSVDSAARPSALAVRDTIGKYLVRGKHKGLFVHGVETIFELSHANPHVRLKIGDLGMISVNYDGLRFVIAEVSGNVYINNQRAAVTMELPEACVLTYGDPALGSGRAWPTFSSSHPEVIS